MAKRAVPLDQLPQFCDFDCPAAAFPPAETAGICRTMAAVFCTRLKRLVNKNRPCEVRKLATESAPRGEGKSSKAGKRPRASR